MACGRLCSWVLAPEYLGGKTFVWDSDVGVIATRLLLQSERYGEGKGEVVILEKTDEGSFSSLIYRSTTI